MYPDPTLHETLRDGRWQPAQLLSRYRTPQGWRAVVRYRDQAGEWFTENVGQDEIRKTVD